MKALGAKLRWAALLGLLALLSACAHLSPPTSQTDASRQFWSGRLALTVHSDPPQSLSASFELRGDAKEGALQLTGPLGTTIAELSWTPQQALWRAGQQTRAYASLDELVAQATGTPLPVAALFDWLSGDNTPVDGWRAELAQLPMGQLSAHREQPLPTADLRIVLDR